MEITIYFTGGAYKGIFTATDTVSFKFCDIYELNNKQELLDNEIIFVEQIVETKVIGILNILKKFKKNRFFYMK